MKLMLKIAGLFILVLVLLGACAWAAASFGWNRESLRLMERLDAGAREPFEALVPPSAPVSGSVSLSVSVPASEAAVLPLPVARYLSRALPEDGRRIRLATLEQAGELRVAGGPDGWKPFRATEALRGHPPALVRDAQIRLGPFLSVRVRDGYLDGAGLALARAAGVLDVTDAWGGSAGAQDALLRALVAAVWTPSRLLPGGGLVWTEVDDSTAIATLSDGDVSASARFRFDSRADLVEVSVPARPRLVEGRLVETPWVVRFGDFGEAAGFRVPARAEAAWILPHGEHPYWRAHVASVRYQTSRAWGGA